MKARLESMTLDVWPDGLAVLPSRVRFAGRMGGAR